MSLDQDERKAYGFPSLYAPMLIRVWARVRAWARVIVIARARAWLWARVWAMARV